MKAIIDNLEVLITVAFFIITSVAGLIMTIRAKIKGGRWLEIAEVIRQFVKEAETFIGLTGAQKKQYVKTAVESYILKNKYTYDDKKIDEIIEEEVDLTKVVNVNKKDAQPIIIGTAPIVAAEVAADTFRVEANAATNPVATQGAQNGQAINNQANNQNNNG